MGEDLGDHGGIFDGGDDFQKAATLGAVFQVTFSYASPGAWRWLGWLAPGPVTGIITRYPAENFGPLPGSGENAGSRER